MLKEKGYEFMGEIIPIVTTDGVGVIVGLYDTDILIDRMEKHCNCTLDEDSMLQASFSAFKRNFRSRINPTVLLTSEIKFFYRAFLFRLQVKKILLKQCST